MFSTKKNTSWFQQWFNSPYYHLLYADRDEKEAALFIDHLIERLKPKPGSLMLDVACGKGRHSIQLAEKGYEVTGIDISEESIREAKQYEQASLEFFVHDMRQPFRMNMYDYAFNFFTSFGYFHTEREHNNALRTIAQSLKKEGTLVIDYLNVHYVEQHLEQSTFLERNGVKFDVKRHHDAHFFYKEIKIQDPSAISEPLIFMEKVAKFSLGDFTDMLSYQGIQIQEVFGSYHFEPFNLYSSPRLILIGKKM
jgi:SAM-dependent methyltransferase